MYFGFVELSGCVPWLGWTIGSCILVGDIELRALVGVLLGCVPWFGDNWVYFG